ncbi:MAG: hypothetical protein WBG62_14415, partial [Cyclobacteriaceae bacterium]
YRTLRKVRPELIVVNTHDLLIVTVIYKILFGSKICYDVQENYFRNIYYGQGLPALLRPLVAAAVRLKEQLTTPFIDRFLMAEACYEEQLSFMRRRAIILQNKFIGLPTKHYAGNSENTNINLVYTGTLALSRGIMEAIDFAVRLNEVYPVCLTIAGYAPEEEIRSLIARAAAPHSFIRITGLDRPLPYPDILKAIKVADMVLIPLKTNSSTEDKIPTKVFEALAVGKRMIIQENSAIERFCEPYKACIAIDFACFNPSEVLRMLQTRTFYVKAPGKEVLWSSEEEKWTALVADLLE